MAAYYVVKKKPDGSAVVESNNSIAKQNFFGWGSGQNRDEGSFYGTDVGPWRGDNTRWRWTLSPSAVRLMIRNIEGHIDDPNYYLKKDVPSARELLRKLQAPVKIRKGR